MSLVQVIDAHIPSLSDENEAEISDAIVDPDTDLADYAIRTCGCGIRIDGFYEYVDHLKEKLHEAGLITNMGVRLT